MNVFTECGDTVTSHVSSPGRFAILMTIGMGLPDELPITSPAEPSGFTNAILSFHTPVVSTRFAPGFTNWLKWRITKYSPLNVTWPDSRFTVTNAFCRQFQLLM